jgi:hypothetical protein
LSSDDFSSEICFASSGDGNSGLSLSNIIFSEFISILNSDSRC